MLKFYIQTLFAPFLFNVSVNAQYCTAVGPSTGADSNLKSFYLAGESGTDINFIGCPGVVGLDNQTFAQTVTLTAGSNYSAFSGFGTCGGNYPGVGQGWIDYNQNQIFEPTESIGTWVGTPPTAVSTWNFSVPAGATPGVTRLRVVHFEGGALPINPCATFTWGSTTDFTVQIGGGIDCSTYAGESLTDPRIISALPYSEDHNNSICYSNVLTVYSSPDVFYRILPTLIGADFLTVSLCGSTIDTFLSILDADGNVIWYNDDFTSCGTSSQITFSSSSLDTVYIAVQGWGAVTGDYKIAVNEELLAINESELFKISFYPNPAKSEITIKSLSSGFVELYDLTGKIVLGSTFQPSDVIDVSSLSSGTYLLKFYNESGQYNQKLVIE